MGVKETLGKLTKNLFPDYDVEEERDEEFDEFDELEERTQVPAHVSDAKQPVYSRTPDSSVGIASRSSIEMKVVTPTRYDAVTQIADLLLEKKTVLLNLENTNKETAKRLIDFLSGVAYALGGDVQKVADNTFAVTPNNVAVSNEAVGEEMSIAADEGQYQ